MATYKIKGKRYLRKYTAPVLTPVYGAAGDVATMTTGLCECPWRPVEPLDACLPSHAEAALDGNVASRDFFDAAAFCAGHADGLHRIYGQAACYVFTLPDEAVGASLTSLSVPVYSDPYNAGGVRLAVHTASTLGIPTDCATARTGSAHVDGVAPRTSSTSESGAQTWTGAHATATITPSSAITLQKYLMVVVALESFVARAGYAEGAAHAMNAFSITTSAAVSADGWTDGNTAPIDCTGEASSVVLFAGGASPTWLQPLPTQNAGSQPPAVPPDLKLREAFFTPEQVKTSTVTDTYKFTMADVPTAIELSFNVTGLNVTSVLFRFMTQTTWNPLSKNGYNWYYHYDNGYGYFYSLTAYGVSVFPPSSDSEEYGELLCNSFEYTTNGSGGYTVNNIRIQVHVRQIDRYYVMLVMMDGALEEAAVCSSPDEGGRRSDDVATVTTVSEGTEWTVSALDVNYSVMKSGTAVTMKRGTSQIGTWTTAVDAAPEFFDASVALRLSNSSVQNYGLAAALGDFSSAIATFEPGTQPPNVEMLGRLVRNSCNSNSAMMYLHPNHGALAEELDTMRPVPRFFREADNPPANQTTCQPGLSVWYKRPATGSSASAAYAYDAGSMISITKVTNPVFLQYTLLALRAKAAAEPGMKLELMNVDGSDLHNAFILRFVAWASPANEWDNSNSFALSAMGSMSGVYRTAGEDTASWTVDCSGALAPFGSRMVTVRRVGISPPVSGTIGDEERLEIPLARGFGKDDVLLIAPVVETFAPESSAASAYFGRQADPTSSTTGWARYSTDLGWFPKVTLLS